MAARRHLVNRVVEVADLFALEADEVLARVDDGGRADRERQRGHDHAARSPGHPQERDQANHAGHGEPLREEPHVTERFAGREVEDEARDGHEDERARGGLGAIRISLREPDRQEDDGREGEGVDLVARVAEDVDRPGGKTGHLVDVGRVHERRVERARGLLALRREGDPSGDGQERRGDGQRGEGPPLRAAPRKERGVANPEERVRERRARRRAPRRAPPAALRGRARASRGTARPPPARRA